MLHPNLPPLAARCVTCVANETPNGWWWLGGSIALVSVLAAGWMVWLDRRAQRAWSSDQPPSDSSAT